MQTFKIVICGIMLFVLAPAIYASSCVRSRVVAVKQVVAVQALAVAPVAVAYPYQYPAYSASYNAEVGAIVEELRKLREEVSRIANGGKAGEPVSFAALVTARCASCHQEKVAADQGGGFVLVENDGAAAILSLAEKRRVVQLVEEGKMPPRSPLIPAERQAFKAALSRPNGNGANVPKPPE